MIKRLAIGGLLLAGLAGCQNDAQQDPDGPVVAPAPVVVAEVHTAKPDMNQAVIPIRAQSPADLPKPIKLLSPKRFMEKSLYQSLAGQVTAEYVVSPSGEVISVYITANTLNDQKALPAIEAAIRSWRYQPIPQAQLLSTAFSY